MASLEKDLKRILPPTPRITIDFAQLLYNSKKRNSNFYLVYIRFRNSQRRFKFETVGKRKEEFRNGNFGSKQLEKFSGSFWWNGESMLWDNGMRNEKKLKRLYILFFFEYWSVLFGVYVIFSKLNVIFCRKSGLTVTLHG